LTDEIDPFMAKTLHFLSGLPRSGSTLLCNLLAQNPAVHATPTSILHEMGWCAREALNTDGAKASEGEYQQQLYFNFVKAGFEGAYDNLTDRPVVVDKCRSWIGHLDQLFAIWPDAKVLVPVRDVRGVLSSMEKKRQANPSHMTGMEKQNPSNWASVEKRVNGWLQTQPVGLSIERLHEAARRFGNRLHFVHFEKLTADPKATMAAVWNYLGMQAHDHDFDNVAQYTQEFDAGWPYGDHTIRRQVKPVAADWDQVLGQQLSEMLRQRFDWVNQLQ
jgi:sulfotransferase